MMRPIGLATMRKHYISLEITITDNKIMLVVPGIAVELPAKTTGTAKMSMSFLYFFEIIKTLKPVDVECILTENLMNIYGLKIAVQTTFFNDDSVLRSIKLPINYTDFHLLRMDQQGFTIEEIRFNKLEFEIFNAKKVLKRNISKAHTLLQLYGVGRDEIEQIVMAKVKVAQ
jgi:hypothetical protein